MSYLVRRLLENTSNESFLRATFSEHTAPDELLRDPIELVEAVPHSTSPGGNGSRPSLERERLIPQAKLHPKPLRFQNSDPLPFQNEPHTDFTLEAKRELMTSALAKVRMQFGARHPLVIGGKKVWTNEEIVSVSPAQPGRVVGCVAKAGQTEAEAALAAARAAFLDWSKTEVEARARLLERAAELMRERRYQLAALEVFETGKNWTESDADVAEAIDFCNFYAQEMRRIASFEYVTPGETSLHHYVPRGVGVVIAPWNFPLAILCGMTAAAVVAGNCVVMKPSQKRHATE